MPEFTQSWAFIFIVVVACFVAGFVLAIIIAAGSRRSRAEEKLVYEAGERERMRRGKPDIKIVTQNNPRTD